MTTNQKLVAISLKMRQAWISLTLQIMFIQQTHTHQQMCWIYSREFDMFAFHPYIELHQYLTSVLLISGHLSLHLPENTSLSLSLHFCPRPWRDHWQQKRLCAESNDIRRAAGSDKQLVRLMTYSSHATREQVKVKQETHKTALLRNLFQHVSTNAFPWLPRVITRNVQPLQTCPALWNKSERPKPYNECEKKNKIKIISWKY